MKLLSVLLVALFGVATCDDFEDLQTEFILPYSETEDVDFHIVRPGGFGCWQWWVNKGGCPIK